MAVLLAGAAVTVAVPAVLFADAGLGAAATMALRRAGFEGAVVDVGRIGLDPDRWALQLDAAIDFGPLDGAGAALGVPLGGRARLSGTVVVALSDWALTAMPLGCLEGAGKELSLHGESLALPNGLTLCAPKDASALRWSGDGLTLAADLRAPRLDLPARALRVDGLSVAWMQSPPGQEVDARAAALRRTVNPAELVPLALQIQGRQAADDMVWRFTGTAAGAQGLLTANLSGTHDARTGEGRADLQTKPVRLVPNGPGAKALSPLLAGSIGGASGTLTVKGTLVWGASGTRSSGQIRVQDAAGKLGPVTVAGVKGTVALSSLLPPVIPDGQKLAVALLDVGVPLTDGTVRFGYGRDRRLDVDEAVWNWAGGRLRADPFELSPTAPKGTVTLRAEGVDLARIFDLIDVEGMEATGTLSGMLPVRLDGQHVRFDGGVLEARDAGTLRYDPAHPPPSLQGEDGSPGALLLGALTDFRYESLRLTIDGEAGADLSVGLSVRGANPSFYDGHPVALNLKLSGALDRILRQSLDAARIPDAVRDRMTGFDK
ncbi:intermembrane phospholipid transport protein YdbH family protein [Azospirillum agricola]|uniref:intermembrane phospholipid transport protein YdbH family protein n=1 Tax=Azospirillum agricola TaxID=1720247 RepID=UPI001178239D|nr:YdbH domain-containing protein [Azospirillum agricola]